MTKSVGARTQPLSNWQENRNPSQASPNNHLLSQGHATRDPVLMVHIQVIYLESNYCFE